MKEYNGIINLSEPCNDFYVYIIRSSNQFDRHIYVGITENYKQRCYKHSVDRKSRLGKKGSNDDLYNWMNKCIDTKNRLLLFEVLYSGLSEEEAMNKEIELVKYYRDHNYKVLNRSDGGKGPKGIIPWNKGKKLSKEIVEKLSKSHLGQITWMTGKTHTQETKNLITLRNKERKEKGWVSPKRKTVYKYDEDGNLINTFPTLEMAAENAKLSSSSIGLYCRGEINPKDKRFKWSYQLIEK